MSYAGSSDRRAAHDTRVKKEENLAILRQEGLGAPLDRCHPSSATTLLL